MPRARRRAGQRRRHVYAWRGGLLPKRLRRRSNSLLPRRWRATAAVRPAPAWRRRSRTWAWWPRIVATTPRRSAISPKAWRCAASLATGAAWRRRSSTWRWWPTGRPTTHVLSWPSERAATYRELGDAMGLAYALDTLGMAASRLGQPRRGPAHAGRRAGAAARRAGRPGWIALLLTDLGAAARVCGDRAAAQSRYAEALALAAEVGDQRRVAFCLEGLALVGPARQARPGCLARPRRCGARSARRYRPPSAPSTNRACPSCAPWGPPARWPLRPPGARRRRQPTRADRRDAWAAGCAKLPGRDTYVHQRCSHSDAAA